MTNKLKTTTGHLTITVPDSLAQVTLGQLIAMQSATNLSDLEAISILSGVAIADLQNICDANVLKPFNEQVQSIAHQLKYLYNSQAVPKTVTLTIDDKFTTVKVINNLSVEPAGAFMAAREIIAEELTRHVEQYGKKDWQAYFNPSLTACAQVLAQYFYCRATGKPYNEYAAVAFEDQVKQLPVTDALPIAKYFFELSKLIQTENRLLASRPSAVEQRAGIASFQRFKYINTINALSRGDITKWDFILNMPYDRVLTKLLLNKTEYEYQKRYGELLNPS